MKLKLKPRKILRLIIAYINLLSFSFRKLILGFGYANDYIKTINKNSIQLILVHNGAKIGKDCDIESGLTFHNCSNYSNLIIGNSCHIGKNCFFDLRDEIIIGEGVVVSMQCTFITHLDMAKSNLSIIFPGRQRPIKINKNCYLGVNSTILMGVEIGENSLIAAGSLINKNIPPFKIFGGIPAKLIDEIPYMCKSL